MKRYKNSGYVMISIVIIITILTILGMVMLSLSMSNYKMKRVSSDYNYAFYMAEGAIEAVYDKVYDLVNDALIEANKESSEDKYKVKFEGYIKENLYSYIENSMIKVIGYEYKDNIYIHLESTYTKNKSIRVVGATYEINIPKYRKSENIQRIINIRDWKIKK
ncbi:hypothetical protein [Alkalithermobacter paradoxus]|uniref:Type 4 fimbrial biogenesis protein PilX N-terminal domain-containing protein n=1 Tax=Alkalithermobacter paradoxus TaxID=29349 RepID=A0A1V4I8L0_9FIRM|nr:hypothetical protein CLOTH_07420 [[Clostridium] thermoalcaliphilum]